MTKTNNWQLEQLKEVLSLVIDHRGLTPKKLGSDWSTDGVKSISAMNIKNGKIVNPNLIRFVSEELYKKWMSDEVNEGDIVLTSEAPLGEAYIIKTGEKYCLSQRLFALRPKLSRLHSGYLYYYLTSSMGRRELDDRSTGTTAKGIRQTELLKVKIPLPSLHIQKKISDILQKIDNEIDKTNQIIQKIEVLKKSLTNELLTKGISHTKFKKTKIGNIPENWSVLPLTDIDVKIIDGDRGVNYPKQHELLDEGFCVFLSNKNIKNSQFNFSERQFISEEKDQVLRSGKLSRGDVVLTTRGTVGNVAIYDDNIHFNNLRINSGMLIFRSGQNLNSKYLYFLFRSPLVQDYFIQLGSGSAQPQLPIRNLKNLFLPIPPLDEQKELIKRLALLDHKHNLEINTKYKLEDMKEGLVQDIFRQKVTVN